MNNSLLMDWLLKSIPPAVVIRLFAYEVSLNSDTSYNKNDIIFNILTNNNHERRLHSLIYIGIAHRLPPPSDGSWRVCSVCSRCLLPMPRTQ